METLEWRYWNNPLISENDLPCDVLERNTRARLEQMGEYVQPFEEFIKEYAHQYPNGF